MLDIFTNILHKQAGTTKVNKIKKKLKVKY